jgi:hypothetical protein
MEQIRMLRWSTIVAGALHLAISIGMLFMHGGIIAWALHKLNPSHSYRGQAGATRLTWFVFKSYMLGTLFLGISLAAVAFGLSRVHCIPFNQATNMVAVGYYWQPLYFLVTTAIQIILIKIPEHVSKGKFMLTIAAINLGILVATFIAHQLVDLLLAVIV